MESPQDQQPQGPCTCEECFDRSVEDQVRNRTSQLREEVETQADFIKALQEQVQQLEQQMEILLTQAQPVQSQPVQPWWPFAKK